MLGLQDTLSWVADDVRWLLQFRGRIFVWNLFLAFIPLALAGVLFRRGARRTLLWWCGVVTFVLFLPNAAYVLTDVVHFFSDVRGGASDLALMTIYIPAHGVFFAVGFGCYVLSLMRVQDYLGGVAPRLRWWPVELSIHALVAVGLFLGRVLRFNSWDVVRTPGELSESLPQLTTRFPVLFMAFTFVVLVVLTAMAKPALRAGIAWGRRFGQCRRGGRRAESGSSAELAS
ncbi:MAG: DUF1361 domain-containing protein [Acidimicrobiia bacterium]|nr:DUF1361 domain-containing protein [Acidimicrobiia bacterium]